MAYSLLPHSNNRDLQRWLTKILRSIECLSHMVGLWLLRAIVKWAWWWKSRQKLARKTILTSRPSLQKLPFRLNHLLARLQANWQIRIWTRSKNSFRYLISIQTIKNTRLLRQIESLNYKSKNSWKNIKTTFTSLHRSKAVSRRSAKSKRLAILISWPIKRGKGYLPQETPLRRARAVLLS